MKDVKEAKESFWELIGFIKMSPTRYKILKTLKTHYMVPSEISKITNTRNNVISKELKQLKKKRLVECMNENAKRGRIYKITPLGDDVLETLDEKFIPPDE